MKLIRVLFIGLLALLPVAAHADIAPFPYQLQNAHRYALTVTLGGASQTIPFVFGTGIKTWCVQNPASATESLWIDFGVAAVVGSSFEIPIGTTTCMGGTVIWAKSITATAATTTHAFEAFEWQ